MTEADQDRAQRDLEWCIHSPPLLRATDIFPSDQWFKDQVMSGTIVEPPPTRFRLGIHFERIFQAWLRQHPDFELAAANLQIQSKTRTLGEFDLLVKRGGETEHWELAVKFYINCQQSYDARQWFGPDPADTFAGKVDRLLNHQLKLAELEDSQVLLQKLNLQIKRVRCLVKGRLYYPWQQDSSERSSPEISNPNHLSGWWLKDTDLSVLADKKLVYLEKKYWLSELTAKDHVTVLTFDELQNFLRQTKQIAPQFAVIDAYHNEVSRGFILKDEWFRRAGQQV